MKEKLTHRRGCLQKRLPPKWIDPNGQWKGLPGVSLRTLQTWLVISHLTHTFACFLGDIQYPKMCPSLVIFPGIFPVRMNDQQLPFGEMDVFLVFPPVGFKVGSDFTTGNMCCSWLSKWRTSLESSPRRESRTKLLGLMTRAPRQAGRCLRP